MTREAFREAVMIGYVENLAYASLADLERMYLAVADEHRDADSNDAHKHAARKAAMIEAIAQYRFGDEWVRP